MTQLTRDHIALKITAEIVADTVAHMSKQAGVSYEALLHSLFVEKNANTIKVFNKYLAIAVAYVQKQAA
ncbi:hypothetical protein NKJ26_03195 [Mesorhizobium sp. M0152]|uniref:hypothetical protein n=1 Tax=Mesorhizobium sp. M0152 TaxID=2956898 RepID=UPI003339FB2C